LASAWCSPPQRWLRPETPARRVLRGENFDQIRHLLADGRRVAHGLGDDVFHKITVREITGTGKVDAGGETTESAGSAGATATATDWLGSRIAKGQFSKSGYVAEKEFGKSGRSAYIPHCMPSDSPPSDPLQPLSAERQEEFVRLLNESHPLLLRYVLSLVGNRHDAEDVLQRASLVMWRRFGTFEPGTDFIAWATTVAFYEVRNFQRVTGRSRLEFDDELMNILAAERVAHVRHCSQQIEALEHCTQKLDNASRELLAAIYVDDTPVVEVARQKGCAPKTLYNKLSFIRRALAECVQRRMAETIP